MPQHLLLEFQSFKNDSGRHEEAAIAIHIACLNTASLNVLKKMPIVGERNMIPVATAGAKLEHAFQSAIETYRVKRGPSQVIRIEKVEVQAGGKAVVGFVDHK